MRAGIFLIDPARHVVFAHEYYFRHFDKIKPCRYDSCADPPEWKERGTGDVKLLKHKETGKAGKILFIFGCYL